MRLTSPAFEDGGRMPWSASAPNENRLPALEIRDVPEGARSLALILEDLDSPLGEVTHWLVWNLPSATERVDALSLPTEARVGMDSFGKVGYLGPVPPEGVHRYRFRLLALDAVLGLESGATRGQFEQAASGHVLDEVGLTGEIKRPSPGTED